MSDKRQKSKTYPLRMTPEEYDTIQGKATVAGLPMSEFIRRAAKGRATPAKTDNQTIQELQRLSGELRRLGGLQKVMIATGGEEKKEEAHIILNGIDKVLKEILKAVSRIAAGGEK